jgi:L-threonylcarbamoyladenylate synthase
VERGSDIHRAAQVLRAGGVVAFPTETVYGLGADAGNDQALARVFAIKGRPLSHPLIVHLADPQQLAQYVAEIPRPAEWLARAFWPGPLTLILRRSPAVSPVATGGASTVGLRVPEHPMARALLHAFAGAVAAPSANRFGSLSPTSADHVEADLGEQLDYLLDGGPCAVGVESSIVDLTGDIPRLLRPGGVSREALEAVLGGPLASAAAHSPTAPGTLDSHYAPAATVMVVSAAQALRRARTCPSPVAIVATAQVLAQLAIPPEIVAAPLPDDMNDAARVLYSTLRRLDAAGVATILAILPSTAGLGEAVADRLRRAAGSIPADPDEENQHE